MSVYREIFKVVALLLENDLPHNIVMLRGPPFSTHNHQGGATSSTSTDDEVIRTLLVPRKPAYGMFSNYFAEIKEGNYILLSKRVQLSQWSF